MAGLHPATVQGMRFFRISGPAATTINAFWPDGLSGWSDALAKTNHVRQYPVGGRPCRGGVVLDCSSV
jgi:hypothetical protein